MWPRRATHRPGDAQSVGWAERSDAHRKKPAPADGHRAAPSAHPTDSATSLRHCEPRVSVVRKRHTDHEPCQKGRAHGKEAAGRRGNPLSAPRGRRDRSGHRALVDRHGPSDLAMTVSLMTASLMTMSLMTASLMTMSLMTMSLMTMSLMTISLMTVSLVMVSLVTVSLRCLAAPKRTTPAPLACRARSSSPPAQATGPATPRPRGTRGHRPRASRPPRAQRSPRP